MKNYFGFKLTGKELFPVWIAFYALFLVPYVFVAYQMQTFTQQGAAPPFYLVPAIFVLMIVAFCIYFYMIRLFIEGVVYKDQALEFSGRPLAFFGTFLLGLFLSIITLFIYMPWFIRDITRFFVNNTSYKGDNLSFEGKGGKLLVILLLTLFVPIILLAVIFGKTLVLLPTLNFFYRYLYQFVQMIIIIPYMYYVYRWMVDIKFRNYLIGWQTEPLPAMGKLGIELVLSMITFFIYFPLAWVKLYNYFMDRTVAVSEERTLAFGYDIEGKEDFVFIWKEILLSIFSLGFYYPWAMCKITERLLGKTYVEQTA